MKISDSISVERYNNSNIKIMQELETKDGDRVHVEMRSINLTREELDEIVHYINFLEREERYERYQQMIGT